MAAIAKKPAAKAKAVEAPEAEASAPTTIQPVILSIEVGKIIVPPRLRAVDQNIALGIADSMGVNGQQVPIEVSRPDADGNHYLIAGAHRLQAVKLNGWTHIYATFYEGTPEQCRLREIDENLMRRELSQLDRATFLAERKRIYELLYPEAKAGVAGAAARWHANAKFAFTSDAAEKCGLSRRSIELAIQRFNKIAPDVREKIALTWLADKGIELDALAKLEPDEQRKAVELLLAGEEDAPKSVNAASKIIRGVRESSSNEDAEDASFVAFTRAWTKTFSAKTKRDILAWLEAEGHFAGTDADAEDEAEAA